MSELFDASQLTTFGDVLLAKGVARRALISASVKKGAQNVKNSIRDDLKGSGNKAFRSIPITYTVSETPGRITAEIGPTKGGAGSLANIAFFGTARGWWNAPVLRAWRGRASEARGIRGACRSGGILVQSIMTLSNTILDHVPKPADGWKVFKQTTPRPTEKPPWVIETVTTNGHIVGETQHVHCGIGTLQVRIVSTTTDSVNVLADDLMIPALAGKRFVAQGFDTGCLTLFSDSGAYAAGLTAEDTSLLYQVRLLTFKFNWSRM
mgnify:CR=1 FL=1